MRAVALFGILTTTGCFQTVHRPSCEEHARDVADDEQTPEGKASDLLANVVGDGTADGTLQSDGSAVIVTWSVARGVGSAQWVESDPSDVVNREFGFGSTTLDIFVFCDDHLEAPVTLEVATEGGEVDVAVDTVVESLADVTSAGWTLSGQGPYYEGTFPEMPGVDPSMFHDKEVFAVLSDVGGTEPTEGFAGWEGTTMGIDSEARVLIDVVRFPAP